MRAKTTLPLVAAVRKFRLAMWALALFVAGFALLWWEAGWITTLAVFLICWSRNLANASKEDDA